MCLFYADGVMMLAGNQNDLYWISYRLQYEGDMALKIKRWDQISFILKGK